MARVDVMEKAELDENRFVDQKMFIFLLLPVR